MSERDQTVLVAMRRRRFLVSGWPWRAFGYLLTTPVGSLAALPVLLLAAPWLILLVRLVEGEPLPRLIWLGLLGLVAEGYSNTAIARSLVVSEPAVGKHIGNIFAKLDLPPTEETNRRVVAVLTYLRG